MDHEEHAMTVEIRQSATPEETERIASALAMRVAPGTVITLEGDLGAGKTCFVRGLARGLGADPAAVSSPTFVIARTHTRSSGPALVHVDAYRLGTVGELDDVDIDWDNSITVVEWGAPMLGSLVDDWINIVIDRTAADADDVRTVRV
jgi:tRNA threonylcarbamoyl adenosine modification protein YjeE